MVPYVHKSTPLDFFYSALERISLEGHLYSNAPFQHHVETRLKAVRPEHKVDSLMRFQALKDPTFI